MRLAIKLVVAALNWGGAGNDRNAKMFQAFWPWVDKIGEGNEVLPLDDDGAAGLYEPQP